MQIFYENLWGIVNKLGDVAYEMTKKNRNADLLRFL